MLVQCVVPRVNDHLALMRTQLDLMRHKMAQVLLRVRVLLFVLAGQRLVHLLLLVVANRV